MKTNQPDPEAVKAVIDDVFAGDAFAALKAAAETLNAKDRRKAMTLLAGEARPRNEKSGGRWCEDKLSSDVCS